MSMEGLGLQGSLQGCKSRRGLYIDEILSRYLVFYVMGT